MIQLKISVLLDQYIVVSYLYVLGRLFLMTGSWEFHPTGVKRHPRRYTKSILPTASLPVLRTHLFSQFCLNFSSRVRLLMWYPDQLYSKLSHSPTPYKVRSQ